MRTAQACVALGFALVCASPAAAQRFPFERGFDVSGATTLDVTTQRGKIDVVTGSANRVQISGEVSVAVGWNVPADAAAIAERIAKNPPIVQEGGVFRLRPPSNEAERRAVTISYRVTVPKTTEVMATSDSGAVAIDGVSGRTSVTTGSAAISVSAIANTTRVTTGSGAVSISRVNGTLDVTSGSGGIAILEQAGDLHAHTASGAVNAQFSGPGKATIDTSSSGVRIRGLDGALNVTTQSGRVAVEGKPSGSWTVDTGSGGIDLTIRTNGADIDASSGSGSVRVDGASVRGTIDKRRVTGQVGQGGPRVQIQSRSGSIVITIHP
jgi:hypothetical protein